MSSGVDVLQSRFADKYRGACDKYISWPVLDEEQVSLNRHDHSLEESWGYME